MISIDKDLFNEITTYCILNEIKDVELFINKLIKDSFNIEKYGIQPQIDSMNKNKEVVVEKVIEKVVYINNSDDCTEKIDELIKKHKKEIEDLNLVFKNDVINKKDIYGE